MYVINFIRGFLMALADSVPGVSGGTIAFIMGFYNKFISSLNALTSTKKTDVNKKDAIKTDIINKYNNKAVSHRLS